MLSRLRRNKFARNLVGYSIVSIVAFAIGFIATPIQTRLYNPEALGTISIFQSTLGLLSVIVIGGQDQAFARFYFDTDEKDNLLSVNMVVSGLSFLILSCAVTIFAKQVSVVSFGVENTYSIILCTACTLPYIVIRMATQLYRMKNDIKGYTAFSICMNLITKIGVIGIAFINPSANAWTTAYVGAYYIIAIVIAFIQIRKYRIKISFKQKWALYSSQLSFGLPLLFSSFAFMLIAWIPRTILSQIKGLYEVGIYASAISLASAINLVDNGFNAYFGVYFYENYKHDCGEINVIHHMLTYISAVAMLLLTLLGPIIIFILGDRYRAAQGAFPFLVCANILCAISETTVHGIDISNKTNKHILISSISAAVGSVCTFLFASVMGATGAAIGYCASMITFFYLRAYYGLRIVKVVHDVWLTTVSIAVMLFVAFINYYISDFWIRSIICVAIITLITVIYGLYLHKRKNTIREIFKNEKYS